MKELSIFSTYKEFEQHCNQVLYERSLLYADAWKEVGLQGAVIEIHAKWSRLKKLVLGKSHSHSFTAKEKVAIKDTLVDLHNYCIISNECLISGLWFAT